MSATHPPRQTVLLTLGRLPPAVDIARSFHNAGWRVIVAEPFKMHMARTSNAVELSLQVPAPVDGHDAYLQALLGIIKEHAVDLVVPVSEETMHVTALGPLLPPNVRMFANAHEQTLRLHSKHDFIATAKAAGLAVPATARVGTDASGEIADTGDYIMKPEFSCSGRGVQQRGAGQKLESTSLDQLIIQQHIAGDEYSGFAIARGGNMLAASVYRGSVRHGSVAVAFERAESPAIADWMATFIAAETLTGFVAFDFIVDDSGAAHAIECNPRATSGLHFIDDAGIAPMIAGDADEGRMRSNQHLQEFWSNWTHFLSVLRQPEERRHTWRAIRRSRDVTWSRRDPWVFLLATFSTWPIIGRAIRRRETFAEVLALDIEWHNPDE